VGKIVEKISDTKFKINDGSGSIIIIFNNNDPILDKIRDKTILKVLGDLVGDSGDILDVKYSNDYTDINFDYYKKTLEFEKKYLE
jgi:uncharacterized protein YdeI (BOF family)